MSAPGAVRRSRTAGASTASAEDAAPTTAMIPTIECEDQVNLLVLQTSACLFGHFSDGESGSCTRMVACGIRSDDRGGWASVDSNHCL